ncbi:MAG: rhodanese-like domain-containing protein [Candidatus Puniceispirillales bacterium]|jgi:rhodanese-related sulfurtransferase
MKHITKIIMILSFLICKFSYADIVAVDNLQVQKLFKSGVSIVDIRTKGEWDKTGVIPQSILLTFFDSSGNYDFNKWYADLKKITPNYKSVIIICRSGRRSRLVANMINQKYNDIVYDANNGMNSWIKSNLRVIKP